MGKHWRTKGGGGGGGWKQFTKHRGSITQQDEEEEGGEEEGGEVGGEDMEESRVQLHPEVAEVGSCDHEGAEELP